MKQQRRVQNWTIKEDLKKAWDDLLFGLVTILGLAGGIGIPALMFLWLLDGRW
jgi:hypothetical protein